MSTYRRQDVLRILEIGPRQLQAWERGGLIAPKEIYSFQDLGQLRILRALRAKDVPAASIRESIQAMRAVSGMANPLREACVVRTGSRLAFRYRGTMVDPIRRQLLFDFERGSQEELAAAAAQPRPMRRAEPAGSQAIARRFRDAVRAEESGERQRAIALYEEILRRDPRHAAAAINLGTIYFHLRQYARAEEMYRRATDAEPGYVLAHFDLGNVLDELERLDEAIAAYLKAIRLAPGYADAHYNLALAYERDGQSRPALRHWRAYLKIDHQGPWADHARSQIGRILSCEKLAIVHRADCFIAPRRDRAALRLA